MRTSSEISMCVAHNDTSLGPLYCMCMYMYKKDNTIRILSKSKLWIGDWANAGIYEFSLP